MFSKILQYRKKITVLEPVFNKVVQHMYLPVNVAKFVEQLFYITLLVAVSGIANTVWNLRLLVSIFKKV